MKRFVTYYLLSGEIVNKYYFTIYGDSLESQPHFTCNRPQQFNRLTDGPIPLKHVNVIKTIDYYDSMPKTWEKITNAYVNEEWKLCEEKASAGPHKCNCQSRVLMLSGCKCGGI